MAKRTYIDNTTYYPYYINEQVNDKMALALHKIKKVQPIKYYTDFLFHPFKRLYIYIQYLPIKDIYLAQIDLIKMQ